MSSARLSATMPWSRTRIDLAIIVLFFFHAGTTFVVSTLKSAPMMVIKPIEGGPEPSARASYLPTEDAKVPVESLTIKPPNNQPRRW
jgi:hypothetical protein